MRSAAVASLLGLAILGVADGRRMSEVSKTSFSKAKFHCPGPCQECCIDKTWFGFAQKDDFKCIAKTPFGRLDGETLAKQFADRKYDPPESRTHAPEQAKLDLEYTPEEIEGKAWNDLYSTPCSKYSQCCCHEEEDWTERKCFPMDKVEETFFAQSDTRKTTEKFLRQPQTYFNTQSSCVDPNHRSLMYQQDIYTPPTDAGCCLRTENKQEEERYVCGCSSSGSGNSCSSSRRYCTRTIYWAGCAEFENLYHCSGDGGLTQSGQVYKRISNETGLCLGDESTLERLVTTYGWEKMQGSSNSLKGLKLQDGKCHDGYKSTVAGEKCECDVACGNGWEQ